MPHGFDELNGNVFIFLTLEVIDGHLCLVIEGRGGTVELWMMKEYRVKSSWGKLYDIGNCNDLCCDTVGMKPLCCTRIGGIIMTKNGNKLLRYNSDKETKLEHLMITSNAEAMQSFERMEAIAYVESLMSLHATFKRFLNGIHQPELTEIIPSDFKMSLDENKILVMIDSSTDDYKVLISPRVYKETNISIFAAKPNS
ncbi:hypothetical protein WN943_028546 [Citrus x changshan-huyou]